MENASTKRVCARACLTFHVFVGAWLMSVHDPQTPINPVPRIALLSVLGEYEVGRKLEAIIFV